MSTLALDSIRWSEHQLNFIYSFGRLTLSTTYWYPDVPLSRVEAAIGTEAFRRLLFHIAAFDMNKVANLRPDRIDFGDHARYATPAFAALWREIFVNVWAQWRYENGIRHRYVPAFAASGTASGRPTGRR